MGCLKQEVNTPSEQTLNLVFSTPQFLLRRFLPKFRDSTAVMWLFGKIAEILLTCEIYYVDQYSMDFIDAFMIYAVSTIVIHR